MNDYVEHLRKAGFISTLATPSVRRYIGHTMIGHSMDYRTPLFKSLTRAQVLDMTVKYLFDEKFVNDYPGIAKFEEDMLAKAGPLSIQKPGVDREPDLLNYYSDIKMQAREFDDEDIIDASTFFKARRNIRPKSWLNTGYNMKKSTNSGTPYLTTRKLVGEETLRLMQVNPVSTLSHPEALFPAYNMGALIGGRGQEGGIEPDNVKQRIVFQFPLSVNILELSIYQPLIHYFQVMDILPAYISQDRVDREITSLFDSKSAQDLVICTDFTRFDQHFNRCMQSAAYRVIENMLANNVYTQLGLDRVFPYKYNIPAITPNHVFTGPHGMGSGSGGTNADESISHKCLQFHVARRVRASLNPHSMAHGDDGILTFNGINADLVEKVYREFGQDVNKSKFHVSRDTAIFLRRIYNTNYRPDGYMRGVYSVIRAMNHLISQERYYNPKFWSKEMVTLRWLSVIENVKGHPCFHKFIELVLKGDKYKLGLLIPGFYDNITRYVTEAKEHFGSLMSYNQDIQDLSKGIMNWESVKYILKIKDRYC